MVQLSTPWGTPKPGMGPPVRRFLSNYFDLLFAFVVHLWHKSIEQRIIEIVKLKHEDAKLSASEVDDVQ